MSTDKAVTFNLDPDDWLSISADGTVSFGTCTEEFGSCGYAELTEGQTKQLFLVLMEKYRANNDVFWSDYSGTRASRVGVIGQNGNDGLHYKEE